MSVGAAHSPAPIGYHDHIGWKPARREPSQLRARSASLANDTTSLLGVAARQYLDLSDFTLSRLFLQPKHGGVQHRISEPASLFFREATSTWLVPSRLLTSPSRMRLTQAAFLGHFRPPMKTISPRGGHKASQDRIYGFGTGLGLRKGFYDRPRWKGCR